MSIWTKVFAPRMLLEIAVAILYLVVANQGKTKRERS